MKHWTPKQIRELRERFGLSQWDLGFRLGVTEQHIYYLEKGVRESSKTLRLLLDCVEEKLKSKGTKTKKERKVKK